MIQQKRFFLAVLSILFSFSPAAHRPDLPGRLRGGGGSSSGGGGSGRTPAGNYAITITGTSGSTQHSTTTTLTVQ